MGREEDNNRVQKLIYSALCTTYQECIPLSLHCIQVSQHMINSIHSGYIERNAEAEAPLAAPPRPGTPIARSQMVRPIAAGRMVSNGGMAAPSPTGWRCLPSIRPPSSAVDAVQCTRSVL